MLDRLRGKRQGVTSAVVEGHGRSRPALEIIAKSLEKKTYGDFNNKNTQNARVERAQSCEGGRNAQSPDERYRQIVQLGEQCLKLKGGEEHGKSRSCPACHQREASMKPRIMDLIPEFDISTIRGCWQTQTFSSSNFCPFE